MGLFQKLLGAADPVTGRGKSADPRLKGSGRGPTPRAVRGKTPPGNARFGVLKRRTTTSGTKAARGTKPARGTKAGRGRPAPATGGFGRLFGRH